MRLSAISETGSVPKDSEPNAAEESFFFPSDAFCRKLFITGITVSGVKADTVFLRSKPFFSNCASSGPSSSRPVILSINSVRIFIISIFSPVYGADGKKLSRLF